MSDIEARLLVRAVLRYVRPTNFRTRGRCQSVARVFNSRCLTGKRELKTRATDSGQCLKAGEFDLA